MFLNIFEIFVTDLAPLELESGLDSFLSPRGWGGGAGAGMGEVEPLVARLLTLSTELLLGLRHVEL